MAGRVTDGVMDGPLYTVGLMADVIDQLLSSGRQLRTTAHPLVEITLMKQPARNRTLVHFVNLSGHSDTAYFAPIEIFFSGFCVSAPLGSLIVSTPFSKLA